MEEDKILHGILLKKAKEAQYTNFEIEQINLQSESLFIRYYLEREAAKIVENTNIVSIFTFLGNLYKVWFSSYIFLSISLFIKILIEFYIK